MQLKERETHENGLHFGLHFMRCVTIATAVVVAAAIAIIATMDFVCAYRKSRHIYTVLGDSKRARASEKITLCSLYTVKRQCQ